MLRILIFLLLTFSVTCHASGSNWPPGSIQWYVEKWNNQDQRRRIASPNYQRQIETRRLLERSFSTATRPVGSTGLPTYQPQRITPQSFARGMFNALVRKHPVATAAMIAAGAYECATSETGFCIGGSGGVEPEPLPESAKCPDGGTLFMDMCTMAAPLGETWQSFRSGVSYGFADDRLESMQLAIDAYISYENSRQTSGGWSQSVTVSEVMPYNAIRVNVVEHKYCKVGQPDQYYCPINYNNVFISGFSQLLVTAPKCAPDGYPQFNQGPFVTQESQQLCFYEALPDPAFEEGRPITLEDLGYTGYVSDLLPSIQEVDEDILTDPATGKPNADFFDNPKSTPISPRLSDAFTDVASGVAQSNNPSAPHYYPPDVINDIIEAREKFHQREPFVDPLTNTTVTPDPGENTVNPPYAPPVTVNLEGLVVEVEVDMNWDEFPGITQEQYEQSNDKLSDAYDSVELPDFESIDGDFIDTISQNPDLPFSPFNFGDIWPIQGGQCTGFDVSMSVRGETKQVTMDKHCPPYNEWAHPLIAWFLQLLTLLHIFHLFSRMISAG
ncbi:MAG: hypothetical protein PHE38_12725 [Alishewanella agri]|nr:hypothetical protein [Alishewanella agri]